MTIERTKNFRFTSIEDFRKAFKLDEEAEEKPAEKKSEYRDPQSLADRVNPKDVPLFFPKV